VFRRNAVLRGKGGGVSLGTKEKTNQSTAKDPEGEHIATATTFNPA